APRCPAVPTAPARSASLVTRRLRDDHQGTGGGDPAVAPRGEVAGGDNRWAAPGAPHDGAAGASTARRDIGGRAPAPIDRGPVQGDDRGAAREVPEASGVAAVRDGEGARLPGQPGALPRGGSAAASAPVSGGVPAATHVAG